MYLGQNLYASPDGRSREGRFLRDVETQLLAQLGGNPGFSTRSTVRRVARAMLAVESLEARIAAGEVTGQTAEALSALSGHVRQNLRDLGLDAVASKGAA